MKRLQQIGRPLVEIFSESNWVSRQYTFTFLLNGGRAGIRLKTGLFHEALPDFDATILLDPGLWMAHFGRSIMHQARGETQQAFDDLTTVTRLNSKYKPPCVERTAAWSELGNFGQAIEDYNRPLRLDKARLNRAAFFASRGLCWSDRSEYERAVADLFKAIRLDSMNHLYCILRPVSQPIY